MISCRELTTAIATDDLANAGWRQRLSARWHLMLCRHCRCYQQQIHALGNAARRLAGQPPIPAPGLEEAIVQRCLGDGGTSRQDSD